MNRPWEILIYYRGIVNGSLKLPILTSRTDKKSSSKQSCPKPKAQLQTAPNVQKVCICSGSDSCLFFQVRLSLNHCNLGNHLGPCTTCTPNFPVCLQCQPAVEQNRSLSVCMMMSSYVPYSGEEVRISDRTLSTNTERDDFY